MKYSYLYSYPGPRFNIKMPSYQYRKSHCGDKTILRPSYLHNGISYTGKMTSLYWIGAQVSCPRPNPATLSGRCNHILPLRPGQHGWNFADDTFRRVSSGESFFFIFLCMFWLKTGGYLKTWRQLKKSSLFQMMLIVTYTMGLCWGWWYIYLLWILHIS